MNYAMADTLMGIFGLKRCSKHILSDSGGGMDQTLQQKIIAGLLAVRALMSESYGVSGLYLNGDVAQWGDLLEGGHFEEWLSPLSNAIDALDDYYIAKGQEMADGPPYTKFGICRYCKHKANLPRCCVAWGCEKMNKKTSYWSPSVESLKG